MGNKKTTVSFRVDEDTFESLREIAEERDLSLSAVMRDYVDTLVAHDGRVQVVPESELAEGEGEPEEFPPKATVPKSFIREHERLELEAKHLREQLDEHKEYITRLRAEIDDQEDVDDVVHLDDLDEGSEEQYHLG
ncbi:MAG: ribbon-helix-helix protein, CopG family [Halobacteriaceae archaeon]